ncbi:Ig-like domain-containing protein [Aerococcaceae bacterium zg-B36]|uniref:glycoside hydrolase family 2 TIM barrel-domain containing protein n=1 Tax=Aerococcaceae bacterium zg-252 TaxID=2796928 RepID=UPI001BD834CE|nr:Ig-like domain-containing protein [Aerococcaceae bacterium zg-B36]
MRKSSKSLFDKRNHFSIRKLTIGTCSVVIGSFLLGVGNVHAEEAAPIGSETGAEQPADDTDEVEIEDDDNSAVMDNDNFNAGVVQPSDNVQPASGAEEVGIEDDSDDPAEMEHNNNLPAETHTDGEVHLSEGSQPKRTAEEHDAIPTESFKDTVAVEVPKFEGVTSTEAEDVQLNLIAKGQRETSFNRNWRISSGDVTGGENVDLDVSSWRLIDLPNDFSIEKEPSTRYEAESGFYPGGVQWYRKNFVLTDEYLDKELSLSFDGSYMVTEVYVNGQKIGDHKNGYSPFNMNLTEYLHKDGKTENKIAIKVTNEIPSSRWYSGSGIFRDVNLVVTDKVHVSHNGVTITSPDLKEQATSDVTVNVKTNVSNNTDSEQLVSVVNELINASGETVATSTAKTVTLAAKTKQDVMSDLMVHTPTLWSIENPYLYKVKTLISVGDEVKDTYESTYGFRYFDYDRSHGFSLNGKNIKLKGVNQHHDNGALGAVANKDAIKRQLEILKEMGANAIRTSHNPTSRALLDEANRQGFLIMEEAFDGWDLYKNGNTKDFARFFNTRLGEQNAKTLANATADMTWAEYSLKAMINRGKNDPSIIMWSLGNEITEGASGNASHFGQLAKQLVQWVKETDSTRLVTIGNNRIGELDAVNQAIIDAGGIVGFNYKDASTIRNQLIRHQDWKVYSSETTSAIHSRGEYGTINRNHSTLQLSEYDNNYAKVGWGASASQAWKWVVENDWNGGIFVWTGFDYIGEPTPWNKVSPGAASDQGVAPNSSYFGIIDTAGFPKDTYWLYRSMWKDDDYTLSLMSTWNNDEIAKQSGKVQVDVFTNAHRVELYLNDQKIGEATATKRATPAGHVYNRFASDKPYPTFMVDWQEGTLSVRGFDEDGHEITAEAKGRKSVSTSHEAVALRTTTKYSEIKADGTSLSYIEVDVVDQNGNIVTGSDKNIKFDISGPGRIVGVDNGNPADYSSYKADNRNAFHGKALVIVQADREPGTISVTATAEGLTAATQEIAVTRVASDQTSFAESVNIVKNYTLTRGQALDLPSEVTLTMNNGEKQTTPITWTSLSEEQLNKPGTYEVSGTIEGQTTPIVAKVTIINPIVAVENYAVTTTRGVVPKLPDVLPAYDSNVEKVMDVPITWNTESLDLSHDGDVVVEGKTTIFGKEVKVQAIITVNGETKQSENLARLSTDMPTFKNGYRIGDAITELPASISDSLGRLNNGVKTNGTVEAERWTNWRLRNQSDIEEFYVEVDWQNSHTFANINLWHFTDNKFSRVPGDRNVRFEYWDEATSTWKEQEASNITQVSYLQGETPYGLLSPVTTNKLRIWMKQSAPGKSVGLTEIEVLSHVEERIKNSVAELASAKLEDEVIDFDESKTYTYKTDHDLKLDLKVKENGSATLVPISDKEYKILVKSEDGSQSAAYRLVRVVEEEQKGSVIVHYVNEAGVEIKPAYTVITDVAPGTRFTVEATEETKPTELTYNDKTYVFKVVSTSETVGENKIVTTGDEEKIYFSPLDEGVVLEGTTHVIYVYAEKEVESNNPDENGAETTDGADTTEEQSGGETTPTQPSEEVETPTQPSEEVEKPAQPSEEVETPTQPSEEVEKPAQPSEEVETPTQPSEEVETPTRPSEEVETPTQPSEGVETPTQPSEGVETPTQPSEEVETPTQPSEEVEAPIINKDLLNSDKLEGFNKTDKGEDTTSVKPSEEDGTPIINKDLLNSDKLEGFNKTDKGEDTTSVKPSEEETPIINEDLLNSDKLEGFNKTDKGEDTTSVKPSEGVEAPIINKDLLNSDKLDKFNKTDKGEDTTSVKPSEEEAPIINKDLLNSDKLEGFNKPDKGEDTTLVKPGEEDGTPIINKDLLNSDKLDKLNKVDEVETSVINKDVINKDKLDKLVNHIESGESQTNKTELHVDAATNISVELTGEDVGRGMHLVVGRLQNNPLGDSLDSQLKGKEFDLYDIHFENAQGEVTQIKSEAVVTLPRDVAKEVSGVYYVATTGMAESLPYKLLDNTVRFKVSHFSYYAVVYGAQTEQNGTQSGTTTTGTASSTSATNTVTTGSTSTTNTGATGLISTTNTENSDTSNTMNSDNTGSSDVMNTGVPSSTNVIKPNNTDSSNTMSTENSTMTPEMSDSSSAMDTEKAEDNKVNTSREEQQPSMTTSTMNKMEMSSERLPETGESDAYLIFGTAALSILVGLGLVTGKREDA